MDNVNQLGPRYEIKQSCNQGNFINCFFHIPGQRPGRRKSGMASEDKSSTSSKLSIQYLQQVLEGLKYSQTRQSTAKNYLSIWRHINKFLISLDYIPYDMIWEEKAMLFGTHLVDSGLQSSTVKSYFSAIKHVLRSDGYPWDDNKVVLATLTKSCKILNDRLKIQLPIKQSLLEEIIFEHERSFKSQRYLEAMYKATFALAYYGLMQVGELASGSNPVQARDVCFARNKRKLLLILQTSKTHGIESRSQKIKISVAETSNHMLGQNRQRFFCPLRITDEYMMLRGNFHKPDELFLVFSDKTPVNPVQF